MEGGGGNRYRSGEEGPVGISAAFKTIKTLPNSYLVGKLRHTHVGFAVHKIISVLNKAMERVGPIRESAQEPIETAESLGAGYAVFRIVQSKLGASINGQLARMDLPVVIR